MTNTNNVGVPIALMSTSTTQHSNHSNNNTSNNKVQSTITTHPSTTNNIDQINLQTANQIDALNVYEVNSAKHKYNIYICK